jgi:hypothetical protein
MLALPLLFCTRGNAPDTQDFLVPTHEGVQGS